jgi:uncharacterized protein (DUF2249 family)
MNQNIVTLDVREDFRSGEHPCDKIQDALNRVGSGQTLRLLVPFEPVPLFQVAEQKGLGHEAKQTPNGDWEVLFSHDADIKEQNAKRNAPKANSCGCGCNASSPAEIVDVDARGLEPPQPMVKILEALTALPKSAALRARTDRRPIHLYPMLEARGFTGQTEEQADGSFITHIRRS